MSVISQVEEEIDSTPAAQGGDPAETVGVISTEPEMFRFACVPEGSVLLLASDGLWDALTSQVHPPAEAAVCKRGYKVCRERVLPVVLLLRQLGCGE